MSDINSKRNDGGDTNKNYTKMTSMRRKVGKTKVVSTISDPRVSQKGLETKWRFFGVGWGRVWVGLVVVVYA